MAVNSGPEKGIITEGVFSMEASLESLNSLEPLENGRILLYFPESGSSLESLESLNSLESPEMDFSEKTPFPKDPFFKRPLFLNPMFPGSVRGVQLPNAANSMISGTGKGKPAGNLGSTLPGPCAHLPCGVSFDIDSSSLLEFF